MFVANANYDPAGHFSTIFLTQTTGDSLTDIRASEWPKRDSLFHYVGDDANVIGWQACEHLQVGNVHFFAAYNGPGGGIGITRMHWDPDAHKFFFVHPTNTAVGPDPQRPGVRFYLSELRPRAGVVRFVVESSATVSPRVVVYDLAGREVREVAAGHSMVGRREFQWDCHNRGGQFVPTGMYFGRLTGAGAAQVVRVPIVR